MELDIDRDLSIDPDNLDVECLRQPTLFARYAKKEAEAKRRYAQAWENVKVVRSELVLEAADDKTLKNATQQEAYYRDNKKHREAKKALVEAEYEMNMASAAVSALHQRKYTLENLAKLMAMEYFAKPAVPRDLSKEAKSFQEQREEATMESRERGARRLRR